MQNRSPSYNITKMLEEQERERRINIHQQNIEKNTVPNLKKDYPILHDELINTNLNKIRLEKDLAQLGIQLKRFYDLNIAAYVNPSLEVINLNNKLEKFAANIANEMERIYKIEDKIDKYHKTSIERSHECRTFLKSTIQFLYSLNNACKVEQAINAVNKFEKEIKRIHFEHSSNQKLIAGAVAVIATAAICLSALVLLGLALAATYLGAALGWMVATFMVLPFVNIGVPAYLGPLSLFKPKLKTEAAEVINEARSVLQNDNPLQCKVK